MSCQGGGAEFRGFSALLWVTPVCAVKAHSGPWRRWSGLWRGTLPLNCGAQNSSRWLLELNWTWVRAWGCLVSSAACAERSVYLPLLLKGPAWQTDATEADERGAWSTPTKKSVAVRKHEGCSSYKLGWTSGLLWFYFEKTEHVSSQEATKNEGINSLQPVIFSGCVEITGIGSAAVECV